MVNATTSDGSVKGYCKNAFKSNPIPQIRYQENQSVLWPIVKNTFDAPLSHTWNCCLSADLEQPDILFHFTRCLASNSFLLHFSSILSYQAGSTSTNSYLVEIQPSREVLQEYFWSPSAMYRYHLSLAGEFCCLDFCFQQSDSL